MNMQLHDATAARVEAHPAWVKLFAYAWAMRDGVISRVVVQDAIPVFMEHALDEVSLQDGSYANNSPFPQNPTDYHNGFSSEWSLLFKIARDLGYCEFRDVKISDGLPVKIGSLINKEKL